MKSRAKFYHAGCPVCLAAEKLVTDAIDRTRYDVEFIHLGQVGSRISEADREGVRSVPALVLDGQVFHINHGATLAQVRSASSASLS